MPTGAWNGEGWCEVGCGWGRWGRRVRQSQNLPWVWWCGRPVGLPSLEGVGRAWVHLLHIWFGIISNAF